MIARNLAFSIHDSLAGRRARRTTAEDGMSYSYLSEWLHAALNELWLRGCHNGMASTGRLSRRKPSTSRSRQPFDHDTRVALL